MSRKPLLRKSRATVRGHDYDVEDWQVDPLLVETGDLPWDEAVELYEQGSRTVHELVAWIEEAEAEAPGLWDLVKARLDQSLKEPRRAGGKVRWRGSIEEAIERELAAVGTRAPAREEPDAYDVLIGDRTRAANEVNPEGHKKIRSAPPPAPAHPGRVQPRHAGAR